VVSDRFLLENTEPMIKPQKKSPKQTLFLGLKILSDGIEVIKLLSLLQYHFNITINGFREDEGLFGSDGTSSSCLHSLQKC
jgi:hypothetical protein